MDAEFFLRGIIIGFSIAAPVGPIGVLCIRRTLADGRTSGLVSGLGAATADAAYGCIAGFGLTVVSDFLVSHGMPLRVIGGAFLCFLGVRTFLAKPFRKEVASGGAGLAAAYASTFILTLTNPLTIISFAAVFAGLGLMGSSATYASAATLVAGVFVGSSLWWLALSGGVGMFRAAFTPETLRWVNRISGVIITAFGVLALCGAVSGGK